MAASDGLPPPGLEIADSGVFSAEAPEFKPGAGAPIDPLAWVAPQPDGDATAPQATIYLQYNQLLYQYNTEVPFLRHQVMELTNKLAELDKWKQQTTGLVRDLREQHRALRRKIGDDPAVLPQAPALAREASSATSTGSIGAEVDAPAPVLVRARTAPPALPVPPPPPAQAGDNSTVAPAPALGQVPQEFDAETGLKVYRSMMGDVETMRADWRINYFSTKLRGAMGRPVVSSPFDLWGLEEIRLMVTPEVQETVTGPRTRKEKEQFSKMVTDGPLFACLTLKVPNARPCLLNYYVRVGSKINGPLQCDFSNTAIDNRGPFGSNWLLELNSDMSITVGVEMLQPSIEKMDDNMLPLPDENPGAPPGLASPTEEIADTTD